VGHVVERSRPSALDDEDVFGPFATIMSAAIARDLDRWSDRTGDPIGPGDVEPGNWSMAEFGHRPIPGLDVAGADRVAGSVAPAIEITGDRRAHDGCKRPEHVLVVERARPRPLDDVAH